MPSPVTVERQSRRGAPTGSRSTQRDVLAVLGQQRVQALGVR